MKTGSKNQQIGVGLRPAHYSIFEGKAPRTVGFVEVISENFMPWKGKPFGESLQTLLSVRRQIPVTLHGVSMNLGSSDPIDFDYLNRLKQLIQVVDPIQISDHLSWTGIDGKNLHDLLPYPYTKDSLDWFAQKIDQVQNFLGRKILIENPSSYFEFVESEMSEPEFIRLLIQKAGAGLLLDINNVYVSSQNHGWDAVTYLKEIPKAAVTQFHLAGHSVNEGHLIDTHDQPVSDSVWDLYEFAVSHFGPKLSMIERDGNIPAWDLLETEILKMREIHERA